MENSKASTLPQDQKNLTQLNKRIWSLSGPMMLSNISLPLLGLVDTAVMGHLDSAVYLAAVSVGAMILHFIFWGFGFLRMSTVGLAAQAYGENNGSELRQLLGRAGILALTISLLLIASQYYLIEWALLLVQPSSAVAELTQDYFYIRIWSAPATLLTYVLLGWFLGIQKARLVLYVMVFVNLLNIALDILFVVGFKLTVTGVAFASLISEYAGLMLALFLIYKETTHINSESGWFAALDWISFRRLLSLNFDIFIRTITLLFVFAFFTTQSARAGDVVMAANAVLLQFLTFMAYVLDAYAHAAEAMVGEALGHKNKQRLIQTVNACMKWSLGSALIFMLFYLVAGEYLLALLTDIEEVRVFGQQYLYWLALMPLIAVWGYLFDGVFVGATWSREMRNVMLISVFLVYLPVWMMSQSLQNHGLWLAMMLFLAARGGLMAWHYQKKLISIKFNTDGRM